MKHSSPALSREKKEARVSSIAPTLAVEGLESSHRWDLDRPNDTKDWASGVQEEEERDTFWGQDAEQVRWLPGVGLGEEGAQRGSVVERIAILLHSIKNKGFIEH
jgi:hypothetical protein